MFRQIKNLLIFATCSFLSMSCSTPLKTLEGVPEVSPSDYASILNSKTKKLEVYDGLYNTLTVQATLLDSKFTEASLSHNARISQWDEQSYKEERSKKINKNAENTEFFVSLYTPEKKHSNLSKAKNLWKIFLEVNGQRYEGKATKVKLLLGEIQAFYYYHNRWSTPYVISFPIATALTENKPATLTFTGAIGSAQLKY